MVRRIQELVGIQDRNECLAPDVPSFSVVEETDIRHFIALHRGILRRNGVASILVLPSTRHRISAAKHPSSNRVSIRGNGPILPHVCVVTEWSRR